MNYQNRIMYLFILAIVIIFLFYYNYSVLTEGYDATQSTTPVIDEGDALLENKQINSEIAATTADSKLKAVASQIKECRDIMTEINRVLPRSINHISVGDITQTDNLDEVGITIDQGLDQSTLNIISNEIEPSATWKINAILPRGQKGPPGMKGEKGQMGEKGEPGEQGPKGRQGPWGKDCSNNSC